MLFLLLPVRILPILITMATDWALSISLTWVGISGERAYQIFPTSLQGKDSCPHLTDEETEAQKERPFAQDTKQRKQVDQVMW